MATVEITEGTEQRNWIGLPLSGGEWRGRGCGKVENSIRDTLRKWHCDAKKNEYIYNNITNLEKD